jgi:acetate---CoA ligase (ADP-forming)
MRGASIATMLEARSVAVVGASERAGSFGNEMLLALDHGYAGEVFPVNPRYERIGSRRCYPSLQELDRPVDLVLLGVGNQALEEQLAAAGSIGARSAVIFSSCYSDPSETPSLIDRLSRQARKDGLLVCGGNCMGFLNLETGLRACGYRMPAELEPGSITFISHSGSAFAALLHNTRDLRFNYVVSAGQELITTAADYMKYALERPGTRALGLFLETVRDPQGFMQALADAVERDIPVVALKVGMNETSRALVTTHSGALAGEDGAYEAVFDAYGVARVESLDEMADALELLTSGRRAGPGGLASIHDSGGERAMFADAAARVGVPLPPLKPATSARLEALLEDDLLPINPLDAWGTGNDYEDIFIQSMDALANDPEIAAVAFCVDMTTEMYAEGGYIRAAKEAHARTTKPLAVISNLTSAIDARDAHSLRADGIPVLEGTLSGLRAFKHLFEYRDRRDRPPIRAPARPVEAADRWRVRLGTGETVSEVDALKLLADYGVETVPARTAATRAEAVAAAHNLGGVVALKTAAPGVAHKSDVKGVRLGLRGADEVGRAYDELGARLGPQVIVTAMAPPGVELALGIVVDAQFGPLVMVGAGGTLVEILADRGFGLVPVDEVRGRALLDRLQIRPLLDGVRGMPPADLGAAARTVAALSRLAVDLADVIEAVDVNPVIAGPRGCVAVDALVVPRPGTGLVGHQAWPRRTLDV